MDAEHDEDHGGYIEAGRQLKEKSNGEVYLILHRSNQQDLEILGPSGLMPSAGAKIWDENGEVVIGSTKGPQKAIGRSGYHEYRGTSFKDHHHGAGSL